MKNISEMSLEELQDYALSLEEERTAAAARESALNGKIGELTELNQALQTRNNNLLMKVEQKNAGTDPDSAPAPVETCEDFARRIATGG